jgi:N-acyl-D-amino-acid deacylase
MPRAIALIQEARDQGIDVTADMYPYAASGTDLNVLVPTWAFEGHRLLDNLRDPATRARILAEMNDPQREYDPQTVMPVGFAKDENKGYIGKRLTEIATMRGQGWAECALDLIASEGSGLRTIFFSMSEENLRLQLQQPWVTISTDAGGWDPKKAKGQIHPRGYGTYPRVLGHYVRDERVLRLEDAVRKMSSAVAARLGLHERGLLRPGQFADIVVFDPSTIADRATFVDPHRLSTGVRDVWVNGVQVLAEGAHTDAMPGRVLDGAGRRSAEPQAAAGTA